MENNLNQVGPRSVFTWDVAAHTWQPPLILSGDVPLLSDKVYPLPDPQRLIVQGRPEKYSGSDRILYLINLVSGPSQHLDFKDSPDERLESTFLSADQRVLYAVTTFYQIHSGPESRKLYEIDLSNLGASSSPLPDAEMHFSDATTSPDSKVILLPDFHGTVVKSLK